MNSSNIRMQVLCALFAAFCAVCSQLTIPIQPVPITLGTEKYGYSFKIMLVASVCGTLGCYILGIGWFIFFTGTGVWSAFLLCMFPFLPGDLAKILLASFLVSKYRGRLIQG